LAAAVVTTVCISVGKVPAAEPGGRAATTVPADAIDILNAGSFWRYHLTLKKPMVGDKLMKRAVNAGWGLGTDALQSELLMDRDWYEPDYDDSAWARDAAGFAFHGKTARWSRFRYCLRGRFHADDLASVSGLYFTMQFRGGAVVYLNGKDVARLQLLAGELLPEQPANPYPDKVYVQEDGEWQIGDKLRNRIRPAAEIEALRNPTLGPIELPRNLLVKGVNVVAIDVRRVPFSKHALTWKKWNYRGPSPWFQHIGLTKLRLQAGGGGIRPNVAREPGIQVWAVDRNDRVSSMDFADSLGGRMGQPVRIVGARNGTFCGQVAVGAEEPVLGISATVSDLRGDNGMIPASAISVLYGQTDQENHNELVWSDALYHKPPEKPKAGRAGFALPMVLRVAVPEAARAGLYEGTISVKAGSKTVEIPLQLHVLEWLLPDSKDWNIHTSIYTSPESIAAKYGVEMWSEKHWALMDKSWQLLGRAANELAVIPAVDETQFGNPESMILYRRTGNEWEYDFSRFDRYIAMAEKHCGKLNHVALPIWPAGGYGPRTVKADVKCTVSVVDEKGAVQEHWQVPTFGTDENVAFFKPLLAAVQQRLTKMGMPDALCVGILSDTTAPDEVLAAFDAAFPGDKCRWMRGCHASTRERGPYGLQNGRGTVVLHEFCYGSPTVNPDEPMPPLWDYARRPGAYYNRVPLINGERHMTLAAYRTFGETALYSSTRGIGRICLDYWFLPDQQRSHYNADKTPDLFNRYPHSCCYQRRPTITRMAWPGPEGAESTARFEAMIESLQDADTVMYLSNAVDNHAARVGPELADRYRDLMVNRVRMAFNSMGLKGNSRYGTHLHAYPFNWQQQASELYELAADVKKKLGDAP